MLGEYSYDRICCASVLCARVLISHGLLGVATNAGNVLSLQYKFGFLSWILQ